MNVLFCTILLHGLDQKPIRFKIHKLTLLFREAGSPNGPYHNILSLGRLDEWIFSLTLNKLPSCIHDINDCNLFDSADFVLQNIFKLLFVPTNNAQVVMCLLQYVVDNLQTNAISGADY